MTKEEFAEWLRAELDKHEWTQADLARRSGVSPSQLTRIFSGERGIGWESLNAIANALKVSPIIVFRKAGLLPPGGDEVQFEDWQYLLSQLSPEDQEEMRQLAIMKIERRTKEGSPKALKTKRVG